MNPPFHTALEFLGMALITYRMRTYYGSTSLLGVQECFIPLPKGVVNRPSIQTQAEKHLLSCQLAEIVTCGSVVNSRRIYPFHTTGSRIGDLCCIRGCDKYPSNATYAVRY